MKGRFAPTPSGRMHAGNIYAMLAAWLSARACAGGRIALRIEDIDIPRVVPDADRWIMDDLTWLGLDWDGEPVYQSQRVEIYESALRALESRPMPGMTSTGANDGATLAAKGAGNRSERVRELNGDPRSDVPYVPGICPALIYPCYCSRAEIRAASAPQEGDGFTVYPGTCRRLLIERPDAARGTQVDGKRRSLRIAVPGPGSPLGLVTFEDKVFGTQRFDLGSDVGDSVVRRSDGLFSYQLAVVVDDLVMGVDSIVRGRDLLRSTALQIWIREQLRTAGFEGCAAVRGTSQTPDAAEPQYAHLPLIDDCAGRRLAKRDHDLGMGVLRDSGVEPRQIIGYCAWLLGLRVPGEPNDSGPVPMTPDEALQLFTRYGWDALRADTADRAIESSAIIHSMNRAMSDHN